VSDDENFPLKKPTGKLKDPHPERYRYLADLMYRFMSNKVSLSDIAGLSPRQLYRLAEVGFIKMQYGRLEEAEEIFNTLAQIDHKNYYYRSALGGVYQKGKRWIEAVANYTVALELNEEDVSCFVNRGEIYLRHEKFKKAAEDFRSAILIDREGKDLWANRARSLVIALKRNLQAKKAERIKAPVKVPISP